MKNIEDLYPLSPMQEGLLFHSLYSPDSGVYVAQHSWTLRNLNIEAFVRSWQRVMGRHQILRTAFVWKNTPRPLQAVFKQLDLPLTIHDWRHLSAKEQGEKFQQFLAADRTRSFKLNKPPLMRLTLIRLDENTYYFVWSQHHILIDGWCLSILLKEAVMFYEAFAQGRSLDIDSPPPYRDYIAWLQQHEVSKDEGFWRQMLKGFTASTPLPVSSRAMNETNPEASYSEKEILISRQITGDLQAVARQQELTLNTMVLGAWALLLNSYSGETDIVFGTTVSGRPPQLAGVEAMVGLFINVLPMRITIARELPLVTWLRSLQAQQAEMREHEYSPLAQVQQWSEIPRGQPLFESLLSFENYPVDKGISGWSKDLEILGQRYDGKNNYPLTLLAIPGDVLLLRILYRDSSFDTDRVTRILGDLERLLLNFAQQPNATVNATLEALMQSAQKQQILDQNRQEESNLNKLKAIKPRPVNLPRKKLVETAFLQPEQTLPLVLTPVVGEVDLIDWAKGNREFIEKELLKHGALLFRGFGVGSITCFEQFVTAICPGLFGEYGDLPREGLGGRIYGSTPFPPDKAILFHNEGSHLDRWPLKIWFSCMKAPEEGGETPVVDCRKVYQAIDPKIRELFLKKRLMYVRNYIDGLDINWQTFFRTSDKSVVEARCRNVLMDFEWTANNGLKTRQICSGVTAHPKTGEMLFFNQVQLHHIACLEPEVRESLLSLFPKEDLPRNVYYGDGSRIEDSVIEEICAVYRQISSHFSWQKGDILMLDNMLAAHGRNPYKGDRKIVVSMGEMITNNPA